ncbi:hypothetical protein A3H09_02145 [Candidatus Falkowbacteria bacterium RIFCSPLOWO2_12_FULL_45_13]|uniref:Uncharacterized protein n=1 Tax=Candidatus Falkowbacteria bacterium RIFCSPLOWO2_12_FULL_45_13 TaxID=1797991 RepID=A0A1F5SV93_9BACT|nr:MAG: hypothetical protein A3H09_02145 [Candidatus Falkowbacteria bacterium RIFCSPLOWO2_12_FULL_45_13]
MLYFIPLVFLLLTPLAAARAVCPICTVAVCASVGLSRWLGVDDTITGLWIGGLAVSIIIWTIDWLNRKQIRFFGRQPLIVIGYYLLILWPLYYYNMTGLPLNKLWGIDKLLLGLSLGTIGFLIGALLNGYLKKKNNGRAYFPFQKVVLPVGILAILSLTLYLICTYKLFQ